LGLCQSLQPAKPFEVFSDNWLTLEIFWATWHQWLKYGARRTGIDWCQVESVMRLANVKHAEKENVFNGLKKIQTFILEQ
jgi:Phage related hypothetical protein (DUF1799)